MECRNRIQRAFMERSRLQIPASFSQEALHSGVAGGTVFPELVTQGATWDPQLVQDIASAVAAECRAVGGNTAFSPVINLFIDSR